MYPTNKIRKMGIGDWGLGPIPNPQNILIIHFFDKYNLNLNIYKLNLTIFYFYIFFKI